MNGVRGCINRLVGALRLRGQRLVMTMMRSLWVFWGVETDEMFGTGVWK